jgi:hypothetical protein
MKIIRENYISRIDALRVKVFLLADGTEDMLDVIFGAVNFF